MDGKDLAYCRGCGHLSGKACDYLIHVGHSRGCPPGVGCPLHTRPEKAKTAVETGKLAKKKPDTTPLDELRAMQLYNDGLDDIAMADALGVTAKRVQSWRLRMHLKRPNAGQKKKIEKEKKSSVS